MASIEPVTVGLIGFGALAKQVMAALGSVNIRWAVLLRESSSASPPQSAVAVTSLEAMLDEQPRLVIEAAGQESVAAYVPRLLWAGVPVVISSVGALADTGTVRAIYEARAASGARFVIPSGAIGGLDYLAAVSILPDAKITYRLRKPVAAWRAELEALGQVAIDRPLTLFEGNPAEAAKLYPRNTNAAFTAALTAQPAEIFVAVIADPDLTTNVHEIEVISSAGEALFRFANAPSPDNPKTSAVTGLSLAAAARDLLESQRRS